MTSSPAYNPAEWPLSRGMPQTQSFRSNYTRPTSTTTQQPVQTAKRSSVVGFYAPNAPNQSIQRHQQPRMMPVSNVGWAAANESVPQSQRRQLAPRPIVMPGQATRNTGIGNHASNGQNAIVNGPTRILPDPSCPVPLRYLDIDPCFIDCPWCFGRTCTFIRKENGRGTLQAACLMFPLICIPFLCRWLQDLVHYCPQCSSKVATLEYSLLMCGYLDAKDHTPLTAARDGPGSNPPNRPRPYETPVPVRASRLPPAVDRRAVPKEDTEARKDIKALEPTERESSAQDGPSNDAVEMEHIDRGIGTQKRIRDTLNAQQLPQPMPEATAQSTKTAQE